MKTPVTNARGVLYQATGLRRYQVFCACSIRSLRDVGWHGAVRVLVSEMPRNPGVFNELNAELVQVEVPSKKDEPSRWIKTRLDKYSPFDTTLFLDCDVIALQNLHEIWNELGAADIALAQDVSDVEHVAPRMRNEAAFTRALGISGAQSNSGVLLWRRGESSQKLFEVWNREWQRFGRFDQLALLRALHETKNERATLAPRFNSLGERTENEEIACGTVLWHVVLGRDVAVFQEHFGECFNECCRRLEVDFSRLESPHNLDYRRRMKRLRQCLWPRTMAGRVRRALGSQLAKFNDALGSSQIKE